MDASKMTQNRKRKNGRTHADRHARQHRVPRDGNYRLTMEDMCIQGLDTDENKELSVPKTDTM